MSKQDKQLSTTNKLVRATGIVAGITVAVKLFGFLEKMILAYFFGTSLEVDAYLIAVSIPLTVFILVREIIEPSFLPTFMESIKNEDESAGWKLFSIVMNSLIILLGVVALAGILGAPWCVSVFAPGFEGIQRILAIKLTRVVLPASLFLGLSTLTYITLNSYKRFAVPAIGDLFFKGVVIGVLALSYKALGIYGLAAGMVLGAFSRLLVHMIGLWKKRRLYSLTFDYKYPPCGRMGKLMLPLIAGIAFSQLSVLVDNMFASTLETGSLSALAYSKKLVEMPVIVLPYALGIVIFPFFTELAILKEKDRLFAMLIHAVKIIALIFIPLAVGMIVLREPIIKFVFERGAFDARSTDITSSGLLYYSLGLFTFAVEAILVQFYFSMSDTKTPIAVGIGCVLLNILITVLLIKPLAHCGIALALSISKTVKILILYFLLKRKFADLHTADSLTFFMKSVAAVIPMGLLIYYLSGQLPYLDSPNAVSRLLGLAAIVLAGAGMYILALCIIRPKEFILYWDYVKAHLMKRKSDQPDR
jgi:murein biosynthesis integral membrane protein MurJ